MIIRARAFGAREALVWAVAFFAMVAVTGCGRAEQATSYETKDDYKVTFATDPAPPVVGMGSVTVTVMDKDGQTVDGAAVSLEANMNHAGMVPVNAEIAASESGVYRTPLEWTMGGEWYVDTEITLANGEVVRRRFPVDVK